MIEATRHPALPNYEPPLPIEKIISEWFNDYPFPIALRQSIVEELARGSSREVVKTEVQEEIWENLEDGLNLRELFSGADMADLEAELDGVGTSRNSRRRRERGA